MSDLPPQLDPANPIHDPVHGRIWLTKLEIELVNTPEFQRLRRIGQISPADLVFPGATHNRFAHSVGAMHVMGWILRQQRMQDYFVGRTDRGDYVQLLRVAALLHDIGHLPFSHVGEVAWTLMRRDELNAYRKDQGRTVFDLAATGARDPIHEELSVRLIRGERLSEIINRHIPGKFDGRTAAETVARIIEGREPDLVIRNLLSSDLDCDRLDYLVRDSRAAGLVYGQVDLSYLIGSLVVCERGDQATLAIDEKHGLLAGEHYLLARYYHYAQFISHKTIASAEVTLIAAIIELLDAGDLMRLEELERMASDAGAVPQFLTVTDSLVETKLADVALTRKGTPELVEAAERLITRRLMKTADRDEQLEQKRRPGDPTAHTWDTLLGRVEKKRQAAAEWGVDPEYFCFSHSEQSLSGAQANLSPSAFADAAIERSVQKAAQVGEHGGEPTLLIDRSSILEHLSGRVWATRRVFAREPLDLYEKGERSKDFFKLRGALEAARALA